MGTKLTANSPLNGSRGDKPRMPLGPTQACAVSSIATPRVSHRRSNGCRQNEFRALSRAVAVSRDPTKSECTFRTKTAFSDG